MSFWQPSATNPACLLLALATFIYIHRKLTAAKLPPGPPGHPVVGHAFKVSPDQPWKSFAEWAKQYGNLFYIHVLGRPIIICNTFEIAKELMDRRGLNYSDRPPIMAAQMMGWDKTLVLLRYNDRWKKQRRIMQKSFDQQASYSFRPFTHNEVDKFIEDIVNFDGDLRKRIHRLICGAISLCAYGHEVTTDDDKLIVQIEAVAAISTSVGTPGQTPVDFFPFLRFFPTWLPGAGYLKKIEDGRILTHNAFVTPVELVRKEKEAGSAKESFISQLLDDYASEGANDKNHEEDIAALGGMIFLGGTETSESSLYTFFLLMALHPEVAKRAQIELDEFTQASHRLPTFSDRDRLPYVDCLVKELYRYNPSIPLGIPHRAMEDNIYEGWTIPSGSMVVANIKQMLRDERYYPEPDRFLPERFLDTVKPLEPHLDKAGSDPTKILFGFGRRICPGRFFADDIIWLTVANVLSVFDILPPLDPDTGKEAIVKEEYTPGTLSTPKPFTCRVVPRAGKYEALVGVNRA